MSTRRPRYKRSGVRTTALSARQMNLLRMVLPAGGENLAQHWRQDRTSMLLRFIAGKRISARDVAQALKILQSVNVF